MPSSQSTCSAGTCERGGTKRPSPAASVPFTSSSIAIASSRSTRARVSSRPSASAEEASSAEDASSESSEPETSVAAAFREGRNGGVFALAARVVLVALVVLHLVVLLEDVIVRGEGGLALLVRLRGRRRALRLGAVGQIGGSQDPPALLPGARLRDVLRGGHRGGERRHRGHGRGGHGRHRHRGHGDHHRGRRSGGHRDRRRGRLRARPPWARPRPALGAPRVRPAWDPAASGSPRQRRSRPRHPRTRRTSRLARLPNPEEGARPMGPTRAGASAQQPSARSIRNGWIFVAKNNKRAFTCSPLATRAQSRTPDRAYAKKKRPSRR